MRALNANPSDQDDVKLVMLTLLYPWVEDLHHDNRVFSKPSWPPAPSPGEGVSVVRDEDIAFFTCKHAQEIQTGCSMYPACFGVCVMIVHTV